MNGPESWSTQQLGEFLSLISGFEDEQAATQRGIERVAEVVDAEAAALVRSGAVVASLGYPEGEVPAAELVSVAEGDTDLLSVPGVGRCNAVAVPMDGERPLRLVVARHTDEQFTQEEVDLLRGMGRVLTLGLRNIRLLENERALREGSDRQARENARLVQALRERQVLLERLSSLQRLIVGRTSLREVLESVVEATCELLGDDISALRLVDPDDHALTTLVATVGSEARLLEKHRRGPVANGVGGRAMREQRLVVAREGEAQGAVADFASEDVATAMVCPVYEGGSVAGCLGVASREGQRSWDPGDQQVLIALAEHVGLALNDAKALDDVVHESFHDSVTSLPNRALFLDRLEQALTRAARGTGRVGVLFVDLDGFKTVNDSLGHAAGDHLLISVAERLARRVRPADTIARFGGDEFGILLDEVKEPGDAGRAASRIMKAFEEPFQLAGREVFVTASVGIAAGRGTADELLRNADLAMYRAKGQGKGRYEFFEPQLHTAVVERMELETDLKRAVERGELELHYQPIFNLRTGQVLGLEALVRWRHPTRGLVLPGQFIPVAEETGQILALGTWVLNEACRRAALWKARYPAYSGLQVSVNLSGAQLNTPGLVQEVSAALQGARLDAGSLVLEITETVLTEHTAVSLSVLESLRRLGVRLAIDDFGTGYSSLEYLSRFPIDILKVAKVFVDDLGAGGDAPLARAIVELADIFDLRVIAEGIEQPDQSPALLRIGCDLGQGNHFCKPLPADQADALLFRAGLLGDPSARAEQERFPAR